MDHAKHDIELWSRIKRGDKCAFALLYERYVSLLYNYASKICKDKNLVEDSIQDLFIDLWKYRASIAPTTSVKYYLYFALRTRIARASSKVSWFLREGVSWDDIKGFMTISSEMEMIEAETTDEKTRKIQKYLHNLSPRQYEAIVLRFYDEFTYEEIANVMNVNSQSVRNLIHRGLAQLKQYTQLLTSWIASILFFC